MASLELSVNRAYWGYRVCLKIGSPKPIDQSCYPHQKFDHFGVHPVFRHIHILIYPPVINRGNGTPINGSFNFQTSSMIIYACTMFMDFPLHVCLPEGNPIYTFRYPQMFPPHRLKCPFQEPHEQSAAPPAMVPSRKSLISMTCRNETNRSNQGGFQLLTLWQWLT